MDKRTAFILAAKRFLRVIVPQLPALCSLLMKLNPEWTAALTLIGAVVTALDKFLREIGAY